MWPWRPPAPASTGVRLYALEDVGFQLVLTNSRNMRIVPVRKTDVADAAWIAQLLEVGLLRGSFVPPPAIRALRDLTRYRKRLTQDRTAEGQRVEKVLEDALVVQMILRISTSYDLEI